jgi:hypothetical protein
MTAEDSEMQEYRQGETVRLTVTVQDPHGVQVVYATATRENREGSYQGGDPHTDFIRLDAMPPAPGPNPVVLELQARVTTQNPGVYVCQEIQAFDTLNQESRTPLDPARRFRVVESTEDDREGPAVLDVGEFS